MRAARKPSTEQQPTRRKMMAAIQIQWQQMRPDLRHSPAESREERLAYVSGILNLKHNLSSLTELSDRQLGRVLDAFRGLQTQPRLPHCDARPKPLTSAEIIHLATAEQVHAINKILLHLGWGSEAQKAFLSRRFKRENPVHLRPSQAQSLIRILLNIASQRELKEAGMRRVTRAMIRQQIPAVKARLGIDRKPAREAEENGEGQMPLM